MVRFASNISTVANVSPSDGSRGGSGRGSCSPGCNTDGYETKETSSVTRLVVCSQWSSYRILNITLTGSVDPDQSRLANTHKRSRPVFTQFGGSIAAHVIDEALVYIWGRRERTAFTNIHTCKNTPPSCIAICPWRFIHAFQVVLSMIVKSRQGLACMTSFPNSTQCFWVRRGQVRWRRFWSRVVRKSRSRALIEQTRESNDYVHKDRNPRSVRSSIELHTLEFWRQISVCHQRIETSGFSGILFRIRFVQKATKAPRAK